MSLRRMMMFTLGGGYISQLKATINRANTEGFQIPSKSTLLALDTFLKELKTQNILQTRDYLRISAYNDTNVENFSRINIVNSSSTLTDYVGNYTYKTTGIKLNSTTGNQPNYIDTKFNPSSATYYSLNNASRLYVISEPFSGVFTSIIDGVAGNTAQRMSSSNNAEKRINQSTTNLSTAVDFTGTGLRALVRTSSTNVQAYRGNIQTNGTANSSTSNYNNVIIEGISFNVRGNGAYALSMHGASLTSTQVEAVRVAFNTYLTTIGLTALA
jgi:hypothetical protein